MSWAPLRSGDADWYYFVFSDAQTGLNDGSANDDGELQGATISSSDNVSVPAGGAVVKSAENKSAVTIRGVTYPVNTIVACKLTSSTPGEYSITCQITTSDSRTLTKKETLYVI